MSDFRGPQPFNVEIGEHEMADDAPRAFPEPAPVPYPVPEVVAIEQDADLYPQRRHGVRPQRVRRFR